MRTLKRRKAILRIFNKRDELNINCKWCSNCRVKYQEPTTEQGCCDYMDGECFATCWLLLDAWHDLCESCTKLQEKSN